MTRRITSDVGRYTIVPRWVADRLSGDDGALALYVHLGLVANDESRSVTVTRKQLADALGCSLASLDRRVARLIKAECLDKDTNVAGGQRVASTYRLRIATQPSLLDAPEANPEEGGTVTGEGTSTDEGTRTDGATVPPPVRTHKSQALPQELPERPPSAARMAWTIAFEALARSVGKDPDNLTETEARRLGTKLAEIRKAETKRLGAQPEATQLAGEIALRATRYRNQHPTWAITDAALASHWSALGPVTVETPALAVVRDEPIIADEDREPPDEATIRRAIATHRRSCNLPTNECDWDVRLNAMLEKIPQAVYA